MLKTGQLLKRMSLIDEPNKLAGLLMIGSFMFWFHCSMFYGFNKALKSMSNTTVGSQSCNLILLKSFEQKI